MKPIKENPYLTQGSQKLQCWCPGEEVIAVLHIMWVYKIICICIHFRDNIWSKQLKKKLICYLINYQLLNTFKLH